MVNLIRRWGSLFRGVGHPNPALEAPPLGANADMQASAPRSPAQGIRSRYSWRVSVLFAFVLTLAALGLLSFVLFILRLNYKPRLHHRRPAPGEARWCCILWPPWLPAGPRDWRPAWV